MRAASATERLRSLRHGLARFSIGIAAAACVAGAGPAGEVDLALVIGIDCSYSVDAAEFELQMRGTAEALVSAEVLSAISEGRNGRIAVTVVQWSSSGSQVTIAPWTVISGEREAQALAAVVAHAPRRSEDKATSISGFIDFGVREIEEAGVSADRTAIDVASDGLNNNGGHVELARDRAVAAGITVNGLAILDGTWWLGDYFRLNVTGGPGSFVHTIASYDDFTEAIRIKLEREIRGAGVS